MLIRQKTINRPPELFSNESFGRQFENKSENGVSYVKIDMSWVITLIYLDKQTALFPNRCQQSKIWARYGEYKKNPITKTIKPDSFRI